MTVRKLLLIFGLVVLCTIISAVVYYEFIRQVELDVVSFSRDVYEKDFIGRSFTFVNDFPLCKFVKTITVSINGKNIPLVVEAYFSQEQGWPKSYCHLIIFEIVGRENAKTVFSKLIAKYGNAIDHTSTELSSLGDTQEITYAYWKVDGAEVAVPFSAKHFDKLDKLSVSWKYTRPSLPFLSYIIAKKWLISKMPNTLKPEWSKSISQARMAAGL